MDKSRHQRKCSGALVHTGPQRIVTNILATTIPNRVDCGDRITNNIYIGTLHNTINQTIININVHGKEDYNSLITTIHRKHPQAFVNMVETGDTASLLKLVHFNADFPENQTIRKTVKKDVSSEIHMGGGVWVKRPTQEVIDLFKGETTKRVCDTFREHATSNTSFDNTTCTDRFLKELLYEQTKQKYQPNTDVLLEPFHISERKQDEKRLHIETTRIRRELSQEFPSLIGTPIFSKELKRSIVPVIHAFNTKWSTSIALESFMG